MAKHKNMTDRELWIPDVGRVGPGEVVETPEGFHNGNFEAVKEKKESEKKSVE